MKIETVIAMLAKAGIETKDGNIKLSSLDQALAALVVASEQRHCLFYKANDGKWYMELAAYGGDEDEDVEEGPIETYGPFGSQEQAIAYLDDRFSNPGGWETDDSGEYQIPKKAIKPKSGPI